MKEIAKALDLPVMQLSGADVYKKWTGKSEDSAKLVI
jgi:SpoVK/Ycf46/Vps4 family AAA+-type ATPase